MTSFSRALDTLRAGLGEVSATMSARSAQAEGVAAVVGIVMPALRDNQNDREKFQAALNGRRVNLDSFYRGLFVVSVSAFEGFVKSFASAFVQLKAQNAERFSDLPANFRQQYLVRSSQVMTNLGSGSVKGIPYNFTSLQRGMGVCLTNGGKPPLNGEVFTISMGNPTWRRIESLLNALGVETPFDQAFGSCAPMKAWGKTTWKKNISDAEEALDDILDRRNQIVHASQPIAVVEQDISAACALFDAVASGLVDEMPGRC